MLVAFFTSISHSFSLETDNFTVFVSRIEHSVNCFGFVVEEKSHAGAFNIELLEKFNVPSSSIRKEYFSYISLFFCSYSLCSLKECLLAGKNPRDLFPFPMGADISQLLGPAIIGRKIGTSLYLTSNRNVY